MERKGLRLKIFRDFKPGSGADLKFGVLCPAWVRRMAVWRSA